MHILVSSIAITVMHQLTFVCLLPLFSFIIVIWVD